MYNKIICKINIMIFELKKYLKDDFYIIIKKLVVW